MNISEQLRKKIGDNMSELTRDEIIEVSNWFEPLQIYTIKNLESSELTDHRQFMFNYPRYSDLINIFGTEDKKDYYNCKYGWVSADGRYYSCGFGGHEIKAQMIIRANKNLMRMFLELFDSTSDALDCLKSVRGQNNPSDYLLEQGWCRLQDVEGTGLKAVMHELVDVNKKQQDTIFALTLKYRFDRDIVTGKDIDWSKIG